MKGNDFLTKVREGGGQKTSLCFSVCTPDPQKVIGMIENVSLKAINV